ncbi:hypothetical protein [Qipengyuania sediminis]|uniref:hypothetical protein n=1 Tax=Qipengyuania sediminis TaxID=1532023 RepID=UPI0010594DDE|nr:hypothetical protein [Qipengyuania sediminis]
MIAAYAGDYSMVVDPDTGGSLRSLRWRQHEILRPQAGSGVLTGRAGRHRFVFNYWTEAAEVAIGQQAFMEMLDARRDTGVYMICI